MNLDDFKKMLGTEPRSQDPEFLAARRASTEHMAAAKEADVFEDRLEQALRPAVDPSLHDEILSHCLGDEAPAPRRGWRWLAVAATVTMAVGISAVLFEQQRARALPLQEAFVEHFHHDEPGALTSTEVVAANDVKQVFARFGADMDETVGEVTYLSRCRIGGKRGIHLTVTDDSGEQVTVLYLPDATLAKAVDFGLESVTARMVGTSAGVLALFGHQGQDVTELSARFRKSLGGFSVAAMGS